MPPPAPARPKGGPIAVMDLEWTAWEGSRAQRWSGPGEEREIVQIGAVKLRDDPEITEAAALDVLVRPRLNPDLSDYFIALTGITQDRVERDGVAFADGLARLAGFLGTDVGAVYSYGTDFEVVRHNCVLADVPFPFDEALFLDARALLAGLVGPHLMTIDSSDLPRVMGFPAPGPSHQGIDDCRCVAETLRIMRRQGKF